MRQFDMNGPFGKGMIETDSQGKPLPATLQRQKTTADALRSMASETQTGRKISDRQKSLEEAGL